MEQEQGRKLNINLDFVDWKCRILTCKQEGKYILGKESRVYQPSMREWYGTISRWQEAIWLEHVCKEYEGEAAQSGN